MQSPFEWLPGRFHLPLLGVLSVALVASLVLLTAQGKRLQAPAAPDGVVSHEFAWNAKRAQRILDSWRDRLPVAARQLRIDFGFLGVYPLFLSLACTLLAARPGTRWAPVGLFISWAVLFAALLDAAENLALLQMLREGASDGMARLAGWSAGVKFVLVYSGLGYILLGVLGLLFGGLRSGG